MKTADLIATLGVSLLLLAFLLQAAKIIKSESLTYGLLNLFGAGISGYASWLIGFVPFVVLESAWALVALFSLFKALKS